MPTGRNRGDATTILKAHHKTSIRHNAILRCLIALHDSNRRDKRPQYFARYVNDIFQKRMPSTVRRFALQNTTPQTHKSMQLHQGRALLLIQGCADSRRRDFRRAESACIARSRSTYSELDLLSCFSGLPAKQL